MSDFNADKYNAYDRSHAASASSGLTAGVESGLGMVKKLARGDIQPEQKTKGSIYRQETVMTQVSENGKSFQIRN